MQQGRYSLGQVRGCFAYKSKNQMNEDATTKSEMPQLLWGRGRRAHGHSAAPYGATPKSEEQQLRNTEGCARKWGRQST